MDWVAASSPVSDRGDPLGNHSEHDSDSEPELEVTAPATVPAADAAPAAKPRPEEASEAAPGPALVPKAEPEPTEGEQDQDVKDMERARRSSVGYGMKAFGSVGALSLLSLSCPSCSLNMGTNSLSVLQRHLQYECQQRNVIQCTMCPYNTNREMAMTRHMNQMHPFPTGPAPAPTLGLPPPPAPRGRRRGGRRPGPRPGPRRGKASSRSDHVGYLDGESEPSEPSETSVKTEPRWM